MYTMSCYKINYSCLKDESSGNMKAMGEFVHLGMNQLMYSTIKCEQQDYIISTVE